MNLYSPQTDIQVGKQNADLMAQKLPLCNDPKVDAYLTRLGMRLVAKLPTRGVTYPWEFHCVNDKSINAFALPGGYVFVNRGAIEAADNESQLAAVMGHELSHVALRHGTAQATKAQFTQGAAGILGSLLGGSAGGQLLDARRGLGRRRLAAALFARRRNPGRRDGHAGALRRRVRPAGDGAILREATGGDQRQESAAVSLRPSESGNRVERVDQEIDKLGGPPPNAKKDSADFEAIKREVLALPVPKKGATVVAAANAGPPPAPSAHYAEYSGSVVFAEVSGQLGPVGRREGCIVRPAERRGTGKRRTELRWPTE